MSTGIGERLGAMDGYFYTAKKKKIFQATRARLPCLLSLAATNTSSQDKYRREGKETSPVEKRFPSLKAFS